MTARLQPLLQELGYDEIDVPAVRGRDRFLTRSIASWAFTQTDEDGSPSYSGLRYGSRLGDYECWAIFSGTALGARREFAIHKDDDALLEIARVFDLTVH